jgi:hypothetical protein
MNVQELELLTDDALGHNPSQFLIQEPNTAVLREREGVETHTPFPSRDLSVWIAALNPSPVDGTTINFSPFSWAVCPPGQDSRNQVRKARTSLYPEI